MDNWNLIIDNQGEIPLSKPRPDSFVQYKAESVIEPKIMRFPVLGKDTSIFLGAIYAVSGAFLGISRV